MTMAIHDFPRCAAYLKGARYKLNDPDMDDYGWAVALSHTWTDEFLVEDGRVNFDTMSGTAILTEFERLFRDGWKQKSSDAPTFSMPAADMDKLRAFLGSRGIKTSLLTKDAYWEVASILWPDHVENDPSKPLDDLLSIISNLSKKQRQAAHRNLSKVPARWRAR